MLERCINLVKLLSNVALGNNYSTRKKLLKRRLLLNNNKHFNKNLAQDSKDMC
jgi:outer membrane protein assembly factor BamA